MPGAPPHPTLEPHPTHPPCAAVLLASPALRVVAGGAEDSSPRAALAAATGRRRGRSALRLVRSDGGQASVELVALLPLVVAIVAVAWQAVLAGQTVWEARVAARAAARANAFGADAAAAARAHLPRGFETGLKVKAGDDGDVRVSLRVPGVLGMVRLGRVGATSHFRPQGG